MVMTGTLFALFISDKGGIVNTPFPRSVEVEATLGGRHSSSPSNMPRGRESA